MSKTNLFLIVVTFSKPAEEVEAFLPQHREFLKKAFDEGVLMVSGSQNPRVGGVIIGRFEDRPMAESFIQGDPFYMADVADYEIVEFVPSRAIPQLSQWLGLDS